MAQAAAAAIGIEALAAQQATQTAAAGKVTGEAIGATVAAAPVVLLTGAFWYLFSKIGPHSNIVSAEQELEALKGASAASSIKNTQHSQKYNIDSSAAPINTVSTKPSTQHQNAKDPFAQLGIVPVTYTPLVSGKDKNKAPQLPPRRLNPNNRPKVSNLNTPSTQAVNNTQITVPVQTTTNSTGKMTYGTLTHNPVSRTKINVPVYDAKNLNTDLQQRQKVNTQQLTNYISNDDANIDLRDLNFLNINLPTQTGEIKPTALVGTSSTNGLFESYHQRSKGATQYPTTSVAPLGIGAATIPLVRNLGANTASVPLNKVGKVAQKGLVGAKNLGSKIPGEFNKIKAGLDFGKVMQIITTAGVIHNAAMLSSDLLKSCMTVVDNTMALAGLKNADGTAFNTSNVLGRAIKDFIIQIVGVKTYADIKRKFALYNAVYRSVTNAASTIQNMQQNMLNVATLGSNYTGKIGNALMTHNVIPPSSYDWMNENLEPKNTRADRLNNSLGNLVQIADDFAQISGDLVDIKTNIQQLKSDKKEIEKSVDAAVKDLNKKDADKEKASEPPDIKIEDTISSGTT